MARRSVKALGVHPRYTKMNPLKCSLLKRIMPSNNQAARSDVDALSIKPLTTILLCPLKGVFEALSIEYPAIPIARNLVIKDSTVEESLSLFASPITFLDGCLRGG